MATKKEEIMTFDKLVWSLSYLAGECFDGAEGLKENPLTKAWISRFSSIFNIVNEVSDAASAEEKQECDLIRVWHIENDFYALEEIFALKIDAETKNFILKKMLLNICSHVLKLFNAVSVLPQNHRFCSESLDERLKIIRAAYGKENRWHRGGD